jgi:hypothetical protein
VAGTERLPSAPGRERADLVFAYTTAFERRWSANDAYFLGLRRT